MKTEDLKKLVKDIKKGKGQCLKQKDTFKFKCTACGRCCFNIDVMVGIYDLIRLRNATKLTTQELLKKGLLTFYLGSSSGVPVLIINFSKVDSTSKVTRCPFLAPGISFNEVAKKLKVNISNHDEKIKLIEKYKGDPQRMFKDLKGLKIKRWLCGVHKDRPIICRLFPLGRMKMIKKDNLKDFEEKFFLQKKVDWCAGWKTKEKQTLKSFLDHAEFWQYKTGSDKSHEILNLFLKSGFFATTKDNEKGKVKALFKNDSPILMFAGNLIYNFDSIRYFSEDKRVLKTIYEKSSHQDYMYVLKKINFIVDHFIKLFLQQKVQGKDINQFIISFITKEVKIDDQG